jgi:UDP-glucose 6-dehydrogenase
MNITVVGTGYVGLVTGTCFANAGNRVTCLDIDAKKVETLVRGESPFFEPRLSELMTRSIQANRLTFQLRDSAQQHFHSSLLNRLCPLVPPIESQKN